MPEISASSSFQPSLTAQIEGMIASIQSRQTSTTYHRFLLDVMTHWLDSVAQSSWRKTALEFEPGQTELTRINILLRTIDEYNILQRFLSKQRKEDMLASTVQYSLIAGGGLSLQASVMVLVHYLAGQAIALAKIIVVAKLIGLVVAAILISGLAFALYYHIQEKNLETALNAPLDFSKTYPTMNEESLAESISGITQVGKTFQANYPRRYDFFQDNKEALAQLFTPSASAVSISP